MQKLKELLKSKKVFTKKRIIVLCAALAAVVTAAAVILPKLGKSGGADAGTEIRTTTLEAQTMTEAVTVSGLVGCQSVVNITAPGTEKVKEIAIVVGQKVSKGDILFRLDTTEIDKELAKLGTSGAQAVKDAQEIYNSAVAAQKTADENFRAAEARYNAVHTAAQTANAPYKRAADSCAYAKSAYDAALARKEQAGAALNAAIAAQAAANTALADATNALNRAQADYDAASAAYAQAPADPADVKAGLQKAMLDADAARSAANTALAAAQKTAADAGPKTASAQAAFDAAQSALSEAENTYGEAKTNSNFDALETAWNAASAAESTAKDLLDAAKSAQTSAGESVKSARRTLEAAKNSTDYADLKKKRDACTIKAETNGVVTEINATVGSAQGTSPLAVVQDVENLVVSVNIKEFDIEKIKIGQEVVIKSDATGTADIRGKVTQIAMTAKSGEGSSGGVAFPAVITVTTKNSGLRVGMNVKAQIILSKKDGVFMVPQEAVGDENGKSVVYAKDGANWKPIEVTVGQKDDYYVEISGSGLSAGMEIRSSANAAEAVMMNGTV
ncbi:MAG: HlyD family efflux transporter periplasmic adaptor subunit [Oscillospiraceae bacterium]|nr:HlyD family efflux transporter periplasmic adaptor subunit [Oscillospiraceae bacterium]